MNIFDLLSMFGGLALFLYGMRLMGDGLKESSSGQLKRLMELVTNNPFKAFLLGTLVTALIQSSTATIVITSGLVAAGIITLKQSLGIILGANVGTTITGQIIRLMDIDGSSASWLQIFKPATLAPIALIIGIILIMFVNFKNSKSIGNIVIGFGILFTGLMNMTNAVDVLAKQGTFDSLFTSFGTNPLLGYLAGAGVAFILQSSSATVGILQALSASGQLTFGAIYAVIVGIYLGDCVTTAIVCSIGASADQKRVGTINITFNIFKSVAVLATVGILYSTGMISGLWNTTANSGLIANANTVFNLIPAILYFPMLYPTERLSHRIIKDDPLPENKYQEKLEALNPAFFSTPALALRSAYDLLLTMFTLAKDNIMTSIELLKEFDEVKDKDLRDNEDYIDLFSDNLTHYLGALAGSLQEESHVIILNQYYKIVSDFERLGDHAVNVADVAKYLNEKSISFSDNAFEELKILKDLLEQVLDYAYTTFEKRDIHAAYAIEPLEEVVDNLVDTLEENHLTRLSSGLCDAYAGVGFMNVLSDLERISDICSNIGQSTIDRVEPEQIGLQNDYVNILHKTRSDRYNQDYDKAYKDYFSRLHDVMKKDQS